MREMLMAQPIPRTLVEGGLSDPSPGMDEVIASGVRWVVVPDAGHNVMIDNPGGFLDAVTPVLV
jgi:pimeloyl-ACP methyl ester carboxylesterase